ncbi:MAG TPA: sigma-70 family RNA polymerase sigma factor [Steroidobacteraceae bacterium]|nr:sigma-70 family RNA polymerase sigma factor [Steroidobacteraceae bacterium]
MIERQQQDEQGTDPALEPPSGTRRPHPDDDPRNHRLVAWFKRWRKPIRQWLSHRSSVPTADLDDLAQEVFLRLLRYSDDVAIDNPQGYLFRIAANVANEWQERSRLRRPHDDSWLEDLQVEFNDEPENAIAREVAREYMQEAVNKLPRRQREVLLLHVNEGMTYKQIAERQGLTYRVILRDLTRAYSQLRMQLKQDDLGDMENR